MLNCILKGTAILAPLSSPRSKRDPITIDHLRALHHCLDYSDAFNIVVFAVACIAFWCCCRLGELLVDSQFNLKAHVTHSTNIRHGVMSNRSKFLNFDIPCTKTKPEGDTINVSKLMCECSATNAFKHHLASNTGLPPDTPLFTCETADGLWSSLKQSWFIVCCNEIWCKEGMSSIKGHGFCIGRTMHLLLLGIDQLFKGTGAPRHSWVTGKKLKRS